MGQLVDGELIKEGSIPSNRLVGGSNVPVGSVGAAQINATEAAGIRGQIGVDRADAIAADISATSTIDLTTATGDFITINGAATVTGITAATGKEYVLRFSGVCTLTYGSGTIVLPGAVNFVTVAGDVLIFRGLGAGVICTGITRTVDRLSRFYESGPAVITSGASASNTHGLGAAPGLVAGHLVCVTGDAGYTAGQVVPVPVGGSASNRGVSAVVTSTAVVIRYGSDASALQIPHATTGATTAITNANWNFVVRAWAP